MFTRAKLLKAFERRLGYSALVNIYHRVQRSDLAAQIVDLILLFFFYQGSTFVIGKK